MSEHHKNQNLVLRWWDVTVKDDVGVDGAISLCSRVLIAALTTVLITVPTTELTLPDSDNNAESISSMAMQC